MEQITVRDYFMAHAPLAPDWFQPIFSKPQPEVEMSLHEKFSKAISGIALISFFIQDEIGRWDVECLKMHTNIKVSPAFMLNVQEHYKKYLLSILKKKEWEHEYKFFREAQWRSQFADSLMLERK